MANKDLKVSISGVRGIIGTGITPMLTTAYGAALGTMFKKGTVVIGRDSRPSGEMFNASVISGLLAVGINVIDIGIVPTPTVEIAIKKLKAVGGVCVTASHNPQQWNALKFFNDRGEFITKAQFDRLQKILTSGKFNLQKSDKLGQLSYQSDWIEYHIKKTLGLKILSLPAIKRRKFKIVVDAINGAGSTALPDMLKKMGAKVICINCKGDGDFVHEPEPIAKNLTQLGRAVRKHKADLGMACDPDADRLALVDEKGHAIGEELTLAIAVKQYLGKKKGPVVINLSTSNVTADIAHQAGVPLYYSKVGEANVIEKMRKRGGVIGGEGNGGVIFPAFHAGRDCLVAGAMVLSCLAEQKMGLGSLVETLPKYYNIKTKAPLPDDFAKRLKRFGGEISREIGLAKVDRQDGLRFDFKEGWIQLRTSNTEPIYRLIIETTDKRLTESLVKKVKKMFK